MDDWIGKLTIFHCLGKGSEKQMEWNCENPILKVEQGIFQNSETVQIALDKPPWPQQIEILMDIKLGFWTDQMGDELWEKVVEDIKITEIKKNLAYGKKQI